MTGAPDVTTAMEAIEFGAFQYLAKPIEAHRFLKVIERAVQLHRMALMKRQALELLGADGRQASDRAGLEASFDRALAGLWMAFQPIIRASDRSLYGYEALMRTSEPSLPNPGVVLQAAERLDRLRDLGRRVREKAAAPFGAKAPESYLFVNLHTRDLADEHLFGSALEGSPLTALASRVVLEITERASLNEVRDARARIARLRELGFRIAIDDLGAGYAGLTSFALIEPEIVKLDMSLVRDVHRVPTKQKLVRSMTNLCKEMGMLVVGEGVESPEERDALVDLGCDLLQGYLFARPGPAFPPFSW
jgi:EAL domain-containing protein (putative c-di-GMP-specific phosphodiesterase class I)